MLKLSTARLYALAAGLGLALVLAGAHAQNDSNPRPRKYKAPPPAARIEVTVLKAVNGKPIENAAVIFHPLEGERDKGSMELKTNEDGKAIIDVIPIGDTVRLQVIAHGFQTYGGDYKVDKAEMTMEVRLNRPGSQYSIYNNGSAGGDKSGKGSDNGGGQGKDNAAPNGGKGAGNSPQNPPDQKPPQN